MKMRAVMGPARRLGLALLLGGAATLARATPVMEMRLEDLAPMAADFKKELNLNANQLTLWQQVESKTRQLLRERQARRERLQDALKQGLVQPKPELRDLVGGLDAESAASAQEQKQLREWWLNVNDALDETQRQAAAVFIAEQLTRAGGDGAPRGAERGKGEAGAARKGGGHQRPGGMGGGMPGG